MRKYNHRDVVWTGDKLRLGGARARIVAEIVQDDRYLTMWRVRRPDGSLSDMLNRTRAKDAAFGMALRILNMQQTPVGADVVR